MNEWSNQAIQYVHTIVLIKYRHMHEFM